MLKERPFDKTAQGNMSKEPLLCCHTTHALFSEGLVYSSQSMHQCLGSSWILILGAPTMTGNPASNGVRGAACHPAAGRRCGGGGGSQLGFHGLYLRGLLHWDPRCLGEGYCVHCPCSPEPLHAPTDANGACRGSQECRPAWQYAMCRGAFPRGELSACSLETYSVLRSRASSI